MIYKIMARRIAAPVNKNAEAKKRKIFQRDLGV